MINNLKTITLAALFAGLAATFLVNELGINKYPPSWSVPDGRMGCHDPEGVRFCMGARAPLLLWPTRQASARGRTARPHSRPATLSLPSTCAIGH